MIDRLYEERKKINHALKAIEYGLSPLQIAGRTGLSLEKVRKHLQTAEASKRVAWTAEWYGRNKGYARKYALTTRGKDEATER